MNECIINLKPENMKTILSLLLFPIIVLAQNSHMFQNAPPNMEFRMDFTMESTINEEIDFEDFLTGALELFITVEVYVWEVEFNQGILQPLLYDGTEQTIVPKYLNTFALVGLLPIRHEYPKPQARLNRLLAQNDPMFPKEDALFNWLNPVQYKQNKLEGTNYIPEGFGPRIKI